jgi:hypothetical protein
VWDVYIGVGFRGSNGERECIVANSGACMVSRNANALIMLNLGDATSHAFVWLCCSCEQKTEEYLRNHLDDEMGAFRRIIFVLSFMYSSGLTLLEKMQS